MKAASLVLALAAVLGTTGLAVAAETTNGGQGYSKDKSAYVKKARTGKNHWLAGVELSEAQRQQFTELLAQHKAAQRQAAKPAAEQRQQFKALLQADYFDEPVVRQQLEQQQAKRTEQQLERLKLRHQLYQILTPEQRQQLAEKAEQRRSRLQDGSEPRRHWQHKKQRPAKTTV